MKIGDAASKSGLTVRAVRLYESMGLVKPEVKKSGGRSYRDYRDRDVKRLCVIAELRRAMFTLDEIAAMINDPETIGNAVANNAARVDREAAALAAISDKLGGIYNVHDAGALANALSDFEIPSDDDDVDDMGGDADEIDAGDNAAPALGERVRAFLNRFADMFYTSSGRLSPVRILAAAAAILAVAAIVVSTPITTVETREYAGISLTLDDLPVGSAGDYDVCGNAASMKIKRKHYLLRETRVDGDIEINESVKSGTDGSGLSISFSSEANQLTALSGSASGVLTARGDGYIIYADSGFDDLVVVVVNSGGYTEDIILLSGTGDIGSAIDFFVGAQIVAPTNIESEGDLQ